MSNNEKRCNCGTSAGQLADHICVKIGAQAGQEVQQLCVKMTEDLKSGKISVMQWAAKVSSELQARNIDSVVLEKALIDAVAELKRTSEVDAFPVQGSPQSV